MVNITGACENSPSVRFEQTESADTEKQMITRDTHLFRGLVVTQNPINLLCTFCCPILSSDNTKKNLTYSNLYIPPQ